MNFQSVSYTHLDVYKRQDYTLADDVKILDTAGTASDDVAMYTRIYPQRLDGVTIKSSSVLYYSKNKAGEIDELILKEDVYKRQINRSQAVCRL